MNLFHFFQCTVITKSLEPPLFFFNCGNSYNSWFYIAKINKYIYKTIRTLKDKHNKTQYTNSFSIFGVSFPVFDNYLYSGRHAIDQGLAVSLVYLRYTNLLNNLTEVFS